MFLIDSGRGRAEMAARLGRILAGENRTGKSSRGVIVNSENVPFRRGKKK